jgi:hypothetical protein
VETRHRETQPAASPRNELRWNTSIWRERDAIGNREPRTDRCLIMNLSELIAKVRASGAARPLDAVEIASTPELGACAGGCGIPCGMLIDGLRLHMKCFLDQVNGAAGAPPLTTAAAVDTSASARPTSPADERRAAPARVAVQNTTSLRRAASTARPAARGTAARPDSRLLLAGVLDRAGLWLPGHAEPTAVEMPATIAGLYELGVRYSLRQVWVHPSMHDPLGLPARSLINVNPETPVKDPFTDTDLVCDPPGLAAWLNIKSADGSGRRVGVAFPAYEGRCGWRKTTNGQELLAAVHALATALGENYYWSPNDTGAALVRGTASSDPTVLGAADMPDPAGKVVHPHLWSRHLLDQEDDDTFWIHRYDLNGAQPGVFGVIWIATAPFQHSPDTRFDPARDKNRAGYWLINTRREGHGLDSRLPDLLRPLRQIDERGKAGEPAWFCTDALVLLAELGVPFEVLDAYIAGASARLLRPTNDRYRHARTTLVEHEEAGVLGADHALTVLKSVFTSRIGDFSRERSRLYRPDIRDAIVARAAANQYRRLRAVALGKDSDPQDNGSGRFPIAMYEDAVYYVSPHTDDWAAARAVGLPIGSSTKPGTYSTKLGEYDHEASLPLSVMREHVGTRNFHRHFTATLKGAAPGTRERG